MVRTQIQLSARQHEELQRMARARRISLSEVIRRLVDRSLEVEPSGDVANGAALLLATCGQFREARATSTAAEHDRALANVYQ